MKAKNYAEVAEYFAVSRDKVREWRKRGARELRAPKYDCEELAA